MTRDGNPMFRLFTSSLAVTLALALTVTSQPATSAVEASLDEVAAQSGSYEVTSADGTVLRGWVYLPQGVAPFATVLEFTPYINNNGSFADPGPGGLRYLVDAGFAVARVSVRGTGRSSGCLQFGGPIDAEDVTAVVNDLAEQPWSNGRVGMTGHSYPGWTSDMGVAVEPEPLKAVAVNAGVIDLWSLLTRRGAPLVALGAAFAPAWTAQTGLLNEGLPERTGCLAYPFHIANNSEVEVTGDRTDWFAARSLEDDLTGTRVPMLRGNGLSMFGEGHILQVEGLWERLRPDRTRFLLGQYIHSGQYPAAHVPEWPDMVTAWFDHYLRGGPRVLRPGVVDYEDDDGTWHTADSWPPRSRDAIVHLSGDAVVADGTPVEPADTTFVSADTDPGLNVEALEPHIHVSACGPHQALYVSPPLAEDVLLAGNFEVDATLTSTLPGGNFAVYLWKTTGDGSCPDLDARGFARGLMDLRHWAQAGRSRDFPVGEPTSFTLRSHPFASQLRAGERLVVAVGGGSVELTPDARKPVLTLNGGTFRLPVVTGELRFED